jgi:hypothetical protein
MTLDFSDILEEIRIQIFIDVDRYILQQRCKGKSFEMIADFLSIPKEQVKAVENKAINDFAPQNADRIMRLISAFENGDSTITVEQIERYIKKDTDIFVYLLKQGRGLEYTFDKKTGFFILDAEKILGNMNRIESLLEDPLKPIQEVISIGVEEYGLPRDLLESTIAFRMDNTVEIDGSSIEKTPDGILNYVLRKHCRKDRGHEEVLGFYNKTLEKTDLINDSDYIFDKNRINAFLTNNVSVLMKPEKKIRYLHISLDEVDDLLEEIEFNELRDVEISTRYFVNSYRDILLEYDIHDEYELHSLLRKNCKKKEIVFLDAPNIAIGDASRKRQMLDLLAQESPILESDLAEKYELNYGVKAETVIADYTDEIKKYYNGKVYNVYLDDISEKERRVLKGILTADIHEIKEVSREFIRRLPEGDAAKLTKKVYKQLGFKVHAHIIYRAKFLSASDFAAQYLETSDILDLTDKKWLLKIQVFYQKLNRMTRNLDLIEFAKYKYINYKRLEGQGIDKEQLRSYCEDLCAFSDGRYFTVQYIKRKGFEHKLEELGFETHFFESLLKSSQCCGKAKINGRYLFWSNMDEGGKAGFIQGIILNRGNMDIYDLVDYIGREYGLRVSKYNILDWISDSELFYSSTMEKIYLDYDHFFEEV